MSRSVWFGVSGQGWFDGYGLMQAFRNKARERGVIYETGRVTGFDKTGERIDTVILEDGRRIACGHFDARRALQARASSARWRAIRAGLRQEALRFNFAVRTLWRAFPC